MSLRTSGMTRAAIATQAGVSVVNLIMAMGVLPAMGFTGMNDFADPEKARTLLVPLVTLEILKLITSAATGHVVWHLADDDLPLRMARWPGLLGSALIALSGLVGLYAVVVARTADAASMFTALANGLGIWAVAASGVWMLWLTWAWRGRPGIPRGWLILGAVAGVVSLPVPLLAPLARLFFFLSLVWWIWFALLVFRDVRSG